MKTKPINSDINIDDENAELNACSSGECTGLIPALPTADGEIESYENIFPYLPPDLQNKSDK